MNVVVQKYKLLNLSWYRRTSDFTDKFNFKFPSAYLLLIHSKYKDCWTMAISITCRKNTFSLL